jgi:aspartate/methionine/tyrosine aminotransferase
VPRPPQFSAAASAMPGAVYSPFADALRSPQRELFPLHVGDTWLAPCDAALVANLPATAADGLYRYTDTRGLDRLVDALVDKTRTRNGLPSERESILVTAGATIGLACAAGATVSPGDEVLILAPYWPLIAGIVRMFGGVPVEVPFHDRVHGASDAARAVQERVTPRTVALYVSTPSNPTGNVIPRDWLEALADLARREDLWLWSDEVYEDYIYQGAHFSVGSLVPERCISAYSFSKAYGMTGIRVGYLAGPPALIDQARKIGTHTAYSAPTPGQYSALAALEHGADWVRSARAEYAKVGRQAAELLGIPAPSGSTFLFIDVANRLDSRGIPGFLADCFDDGVLVAPGTSSGSAYTTWIRLCYTSIAPAAALEAVRRLAKRVRAEGGS